jgi:hypothetical protein
METAQKIKLNKNFGIGYLKIFLQNYIFFKIKFTSSRSCKSPLGRGAICRGVGLLLGA